MKTFSRAGLARQIDCSLFQPEATRQDIERLCAAARAEGLHGVRVNGSHVELAAALLEDGALKVGCLVGFPLGASDADVKRFEVEAAIDQGAQEIEVVLNVGRLKEGDHRYILRELRDLAEAADERPVCVAMEPAVLTEEELVLACHLCLDSGTDSVCIGTGFWPQLLEMTAQVKLARQALGQTFGVKAFLGALNEEKASALLEAGANRLGIAGAPKWVATENRSVT